MIPRHDPLLGALRPQRTRRTRSASTEVYSDVPLHAADMRRRIVVHERTNGTKTIEICAFRDGVSAGVRKITEAMAPSLLEAIELVNDTSFSGRETVGVFVLSSGIRQMFVAVRNDERAFVRIGLVGRDGAFMGGPVEVSGGELEALRLACVAVVNPKKDPNA